MIVSSSAFSSLGTSIPKDRSKEQKKLKKEEE